MREHIDRVRKGMFNAGTKAVTKRLNDMLEEIRSGFEEHVDRVVAQVSDDYKSIVLDRNIFKALASAVRLSESCFATRTTGSRPSSSLPQRLLLLSPRTLSWVAWRTVRLSLSPKPLSRPSLLECSPSEEAHLCPRRR